MQVWSWCKTGEATTKVSSGKLIGKFYVTRPRRSLAGCRCRAGGRSRCSSATNRTTSHLRHLPDVALAHRGSLQFDFIWSKSAHFSTLVRPDLRIPIQNDERVKFQIFLLSKVQAIEWPRIKDYSRSTQLEDHAQVFSTHSGAQFCANIRFNQFLAALGAAV